MADLTTGPHETAIPTLAELFPEAAAQRRERDPFRVLDDTKRGIILKVLKEGLSLPIACGRARITKRTVESALEKGRVELEAHELYGLPLSPRAEFVLEVEQARALAQTDYKKKMDGYSDADPRAWGARAHAAAVLEPEVYDKKPKIQVQQDTTVKVEFIEATGDAWQVPHLLNNRQRAITGIVGGDDSYDPSEIIDTVLEGSDEDEDPDEELDDDE